MTMTGERLTRDDPAWHEWRRHGIGGSDIAAICGLSPWASAFSVYLEKRGEVPPEDLSSNPTVEFGKRVEPIIPAWFHDETGLWLTGEQTWCEHPEVDYHRCTLDGYVSESPSSEPADALGVAEIKVTGQSEGDWSTIPDHYAVQGQWQMHVTGLERLWFLVIHRHNGAFRTYEMTRDDTVIAELVRLAGDFWQRVQSGTPPPADEHKATSRALRDAYPESEDDEMQLDSDLLARWQAAKGRAAAVAAEVDAVENQIRAELGHAAFGVVDGQRVLSYKTQTRTGINAKALREAHPELATRFATHSTYRVLRALAPKKEKP